MEEESIVTVKEAQKSAKMLRMWLLSAGFLLTSFSVGICMAFSVSGLAFYQGEKPGSDLYLTEDQGSWFVSILTIAVMVGSLLSGPVYERIGSLWTLRIAMAINSLGWICVGVDHDLYSLIIGRCLSGLGCGLAIPAAYLVLSDITVIHFRGIIAVFNNTICNLGFLIGLIVGAYGTLTTIIVTSAITAPLFLILSLFLPESPLWLVKKGREKEALESLEKLRGSAYPVDIEILELQSCVSSDKKRGLKSLKDLCNGVFVIPLVIMVAIAVVQGLCGVDSISYYSVKIFQHAKVELDPYLMSIILQIGYTLGYLSIVPIMDKVNRKTIFIGSGCVMSIALIILGWTTFDTIPDPISEGNTTIPFRHFEETEDDNGIDFSYRTFLAPVTTVIFSFSYGFGFGSVVCTWSSELFPPDGKILGCSLCLSIRYIIVFVLLKFYPALFHMVGLSTLLWMHTVITIFGCFFVFFCVPETRGLSNTEISRLFVKEHKDKDAESPFIDGQDSSEPRNSDTDETSLG